MHRKSVFFLIPAVAALLVLGIVMLYSTGAFAPDAHGDSYFFVKRQLAWLGIGLVVCAVAARIDYHFWQRTWAIWFALSVVLLICCFVPGVGKRLNGSARWVDLHLGSWSRFQPSELAKFAAIAFVAWWFSRPGMQPGEWKRGFVLPLAGVGILLALIAPEVDMGSTVLIGATTYALMFVAGSRLLYLLPLAVMGAGGLALAIKLHPERAERFLAFLYPEKYPADAYQGLQGLIAFGSGGVEGLGLGNGRQKMMYLPFAHTDFIFPMIGEELGLRCTLLVVLLYIVIIICGTVISIQARDRFGMLLGFGFTLLIAFQAAVNIGVTTTLLPNKGLPLPFISYGGSNLVFCLLGVGVLISIYRQGISDKEQRTEVQMNVRARKRVVRI